MEFPTLVYKCPGNHHRTGGTYDYASVSDEEGLKEAKAAGWHETLPEAIKAADKQPVGKAGDKSASWGGK